MCSSGALVSGAAIFHFSLGVLGVVCCGSADGAVLLLSWSLGCCFVLLLSPLIPWLGSWAASSLVCYCVFFGGFVLAVISSLCFTFIYLLGSDLCCSRSF